MSRPGLKKSEARRALGLGGDGEERGVVVVAVGEIDRRMADGHADIDAGAHAVFRQQPIADEVFAAERNTADAVAGMIAPKVVLEVGLDGRGNFEVVIEARAKPERQAEVAARGEVAEVRVNNEFDRACGLSLGQVAVEDALDLVQFGVGVRRRLVGDRCIGPEVLGACEQDGQEEDPEQ